MAFVGGGGGGASSSSSTAPAVSGTPGAAAGQNGDLSTALLALAAGGVSAQQLQEALVAHQQQQQQQQMLQALTALLQQQQQPAAAPVQSVQQPQSNLLQQLQQQLLLQQLAQTAAAATTQPAAGAAATSLSTLFLLLQQQQQLTSALTSVAGGNAAAAAASNPLMQLTSAVLQQNQQNQQQEQQTLMQQRLLMEILNSSQGGQGGTERSSAVGSTPGPSRDNSGLAALAGLARPQPVDISQQQTPRALLQQLQQQTGVAAATTTANPVQPLPHPPPMIRGNSGLDQARAAQAAAAAVRAAAVPQANLNDPSSVETRIQRLIKQNEEILEPAPVLLKRRPYHRALGPQASIDNDSNHSGSSRTSPGPIRFPAPTSRPLPPPATTRSQSLFELGLKPSSTPLPSSSFPNGSLTSGQPMNRGGNGGMADTLQQMFMSGVEPSCSRRNESAPQCPHCKLGFPNESTKEAHQAFCSKKESGDAQPQDNRHPLKRRLLAAVAQQEEAAAKIARMSTEAKPSTSFSSPSGNGDDIIIVGERTAPTTQPNTLRSPNYRQAGTGEPHSFLNRRATIASFPELSSTASTNTSDPSSSVTPRQIELIRNLVAKGVPIDESILALVGGSAPAAIPAVPVPPAAPAAVTQIKLEKSNSEESDDIQVIETPSSKPLSTTALSTFSSSSAFSTPVTTSATSATNKTAVSAYPNTKHTMRERLLNSMPPPKFCTEPDEVATVMARAVSKKEEWTRSDKGSPERAFTICGDLRGDIEAPYYMTYPLCTPHLLCVSESGSRSSPLHPDIKLDPVPYAAAAPVGFSRDSAIATTMCVQSQCAPRTMASHESVYENMYKIHVPGSEGEAKLNHLFMGAVSIKPRVGERPFRYEMAKENQMKSTHSSFWFVSLRQRQLISERAAASAIVGSQISMNDAANNVPTGSTEVEMKEEVKNEIKDEVEMMDTTGPSSDSKEFGRLPSSLGGREAKDLSMDEDLTAIVEERRKKMEIEKAKEEDEAAIHAAKEQAMTSLGLKTEKRRARDNTSVDRLSIGDITTLLDLGGEEVPAMAKMQAQRDPVIGGYKTDEVYVYVRGRGRGRYVCERCGIRCKKPSMLKKHIKSHTDVRPYQCKECNFSFKTKGNLTKHLASKAHRRKTTPTEMGPDSLLPRSRRRSEIDVVGSDSEGESDVDEDERMDMGAIDDDVKEEMDIHIGNGEDDFDELDYGEEDETVGREHLPSADRHPYHKFGQEQIIQERRAHTPPSVWVKQPYQTGDHHTPEWPDVESIRGHFRRCTSAPPAMQSLTKKGEGEEDEDEGGADPAERRRRDAVRRKRRDEESRENGSAASKEEKRGEGDRVPSNTTAPAGNTVGLHAAATQLRYSPSDVQLSMTNATLSAHQAGRQQQQPMAMSSSYSSCLLDVPRLASALPPSASSLLTKGTADQLQAAAALLPTNAVALAAGLLPVQAQSGSSSVSSTPLGTFQLETEEMKCGECDRVFRKASDYSMHVHTHNLERGKMRLLYTCPECKMGHKSKQQLARHIEVAHPLLAARGGAAAAAEEIAARQRSSSSCSSAVGGLAAGPSAMGQEPIEQTILNVTTNMTNNPRSFVCQDCNIGFRKHGILAKHLRSKTHVMKLETAKLLPEDSLTLITKRDNGTCLNEVDTTSCETARRSILRIVDRIRGENAAAAASVQVQALPSQTNGPHSSDDQRRLVLPIASHRLDPVPSSSAASTVEAAAAALIAQQQRTGLPTTAEQLLELLTAAQRSLSSASTTTSSASLPSTTTIASAAVWMPPRAEDVQQGAAATAAAAAALAANSYSQQPTINRRPSFDANGFFDRLGNGHSSTAVTPPALTRCGVCDANFDNPMDHQIHMMTDHIVMRDGHDFACPRPNCDKVYPNTESLRNHILAHFRQYDREEEAGQTSLGRPFDSTADATATTAEKEGKEEGEASASDEDTVEMEGGGEESSCPSRASTMEGGLVIAEDEEEREESEVEVRAEREGRGLACSMCSAPPFETAAALQTHWMTQHVALRPHVCTTCDASFTQREQLEFHISTTHRK